MMDCIEINCTQMKQAFAQLVVLASRADAAEVIAGIRRQADLMGGCLPLI